MLLLANLLAFKIAWVLSVVGAATQMPWLGPIAVLVALALHLRAARKPFEEVLLVLSCALLGARFDSFLVVAGWVSYKAGIFSDYLAPYWIITMWMLFATTLNVSMRWLRGKTMLAVLIGFIGGPASYLGGQAIGSVILIDEIAGLIALAIGWAVIMPLLIRLSQSLDGMPGPRRAGIAENSR